MRTKGVCAPHPGYPSGPSCCCPMSELQDLLQFPRARPTAMRSYLWSLGRLRQAVWLLTVVVLIFFLFALPSFVKEPSTKLTR